MQKLIEFTSKDWNNHALIINYKRSRLKLLVADLPKNIQEELAIHDPLYFNITGYAYWERFEIGPKSLVVSFNNYGIPVKLATYKIVPTEYVTYKYNHQLGMKNIQIQKNGFLVYCAPTGQGKTWFALSNLPELAQQFDTLLYINFELSIDDLKNRCIDMNIPIPHNVYVSPLESVEAIQTWAEDKGSCCFIVDNIDNLVGGGNDPFGAQLDFIKKLDRFLKDFNHHALVLTQLVKDNNTNLIGKDGEMIKKIGKMARKDIEDLLEKHIYLDLWVKVRKKWKKDPNALKDMGYTD